MSNLETEEGKKKESKMKARLNRKMSGKAIQRKRAKRKEL